jgi:putative phosphoserine phosphatase/1-acylglycerol-3-phosphate O-acyltransferase
VGSAAAFFDVDRTLVVGTSLETCFLRVALRHRALGPFALCKNVPAGLRALRLLPAGKQGRLPLPDGLSLTTRLRYAFLSGNKAYLRGLRLETCRSLAQTALQEEVLPRLSERGKKAVDWHRENGRLVVLLTGTLDFLGEPLQAHLGADFMLSAHPEVRDGRLTGRLEALHPYGPRKRDMLLRFAQEQELDLSHSYAYADHHTDVAFLETVGYPVAVNPDADLARTAQQRGWPTETF